MPLDLGQLQIEPPEMAWFVAHDVGEKQIAASRRGAMLVAIRRE